MRDGLRKLEALVLLEKRLELGPALLVESLEGVEVDGDDAGIVLLEKRLHSAEEVFAWRAGRHGLDGAVFVVLDVQGIEEIAEELLMIPNEPDLQEVRGNGFAGLAAEGFLQPGIPLVAGFPFDEDRPELPLLGERIDGRLVKRLLLVDQERKQLSRRLGRHAGEDLVRFQHNGNRGE